MAALAPGSSDSSVFAPEASIQALEEHWRKMASIPGQGTASWKMSTKRAETISFLYTLYAQGWAWGLAEEHSGKHFLVG